MERNQLILLLIGIIIALFVGGTMAAILLYGAKQRNRLAEIGDTDEELIKEYISEHRHKPLQIALKGIEVIIAIGLISLFIAATVVKANGNRFAINGQEVYVVRSGSMSKLNPKNPDYDFVKTFNNRFDVYDMVFIKEKPAETDFHIGQIIVYKSGTQNIIHRLVQINPPSPVTEYKYTYICSGDANSFRDGHITYDDIIGVYTDHKIPFVGVFVLWLQSPLGYVVVGIILVYGVYSTYLENSLDNVRNKRLVEIGYLKRRKKKHHKVKYYINDDPSSSETRSIKNTTSDTNKNTLEPVVKFSIRDYINMRRINWYNFSKPSKSKFECANFRYKQIKCLNYRYVCVKVTFTCKNKDISKYIFLHKQNDLDYIKRVNKCMRYLLHSGKLNNYIKYHLRLYEEKR